MEELKIFLHKHDVAICLLNENFLKTRHQMHISGYDFLRTDNDGRGAGTAIVIRKDISYREIRVPTVTSFMDVTGIQIYNNRDTCTIFSIYVPNSVTRIDGNCLDRLLATDDKVIIGGDFNAKSLTWGCHSNNTRGKSLEEYLLRRTGLVRLRFQDSPTHFPPDVSRRYSTIDGFLTASEFFCQRLKTDLF